MSDLLRVEILVDKGSHRDLLVHLGSLVELTLDSYYFGLALVGEVNHAALQKAVAHLLCYWRTSLLQPTEQQTFYLPIDFSDQYVGCFKVERHVLDLHVVYGYCPEKGSSINPLNPGDFCRAATGFQQTTPTHLVLSQADFLANIARQADQLLAAD